ncbi:SH3-domain kinase binding protein 1 [Mortierella sp. GBA30]|nr:SH3-domain kinase binding protein 1 [Mortierella sp. GBA30]
MAATTVYVAHHNYDAEKDDELTLEVGDLINVSDMSDPGWWVGEKVKDGKAGWFPSNFVDPYEQTAEDAAVSAPAQAEPAVEDPAAEVPGEAAAAAPKHEGPVLARVEYDYEAKEPGELSLEAGRVVTILDSSDPAWWSGDLNGKIGTFPSNYVKMIENKEESESGEKPTKFKLAAFGVKQGGLGSLFAGGINVAGLKKTGLKKVGGIDAGSQPAGSTKRTSIDEPRSPVVHAAPPKITPPVAEEVVAPLVNHAPVRAAPPPAPVAAHVEEAVASPEPRVPSRAKKPKAKQTKALVVYEYAAQEEDEISLVKGSTVVVTDKLGDEGWWCGRNENGDVGNFPSDFVQEIKEELTQSPTDAPAAPAPVSVTLPAATSVPEEAPKSPVHVRPAHAPLPLPSVPVEPIRTDLPRSRTNEAPLATPPAIHRGSRPPSMIATPTQPPAHVHDARPLNEGPPLPGSPPPKRMSMASRSSSHDYPLSPRHANAPVIPEPTSPASSGPAQGELSRSSTTSRRPHKPVPEAPLEADEEQPAPATDESHLASSEAPVTPNRSSYILPTPVARNRPLPPLARPPSIHQVPENRKSVVIPPIAHLPPVPSEPEETNAQESHVIAEEQDEVDKVEPEGEPQLEREDIVHVASPENIQTEKMEHKEVSEEPVAKEEPDVEHEDEDKIQHDAHEQETIEDSAVSAAAVEDEQNAEEDKEEKEPEKPKLPEIGSSGPTLSHASRPRPAKGRKPPSAPVPDPEAVSFVSQLEADVKAAPIVEEKKAESTTPAIEKPGPPPKPIKPIFQKFPTPFAGVQPINVALRPTGRRVGSTNDAPLSPGASGGEASSGPSAAAAATPAMTTTAPPPGGVKSLSSRFGQFQGVPASGGNSAALELEIAKLRRWMTEELDRVRKELTDERESREKLQEEVNQLKAQLQG